MKTDEVECVIGKHMEVEYPEVYCSFNFHSMIRIKEKEFIISFKSKIVTDRDQYYFYITDDNYKDEIIYYYLNLDEEDFSYKKIGSTENNSILLREEKEGKFYFLYNGPETCVEYLKEMFKKANFELKVMETDCDYNSDNLFIKGNTIIWFNRRNIYLGKIFGDNFEIIDELKNEQDKSIKFISFEEKCIFYEKD